MISNRGLKFSMWVIYKHPSDYPDQYVARKFQINSPAALPTTDVILESTLDSIRSHMQRKHLTLIQREVGDDPVIVESWI